MPDWQDVRIDSTSLIFIDDGGSTGKIGLGSYQQASVSERFIGGQIAQGIEPTVLEEAFWWSHRCRARTGLGRARPGFNKNEMLVLASIPYHPSRAVWLNSWP